MHIQKSIQYLLITLLLFSVYSLHARTDTLETTNGDQLVGEIKSMKYGVLTFDTDYADSKFKIEWEQVAALKSKSYYRIFDDEGNFLIGQIYMDAKDSGQMTISTALLDLKISVIKIVEIAHLEDKFIDRISLGLNLGYGFTKANSTEQFTLTSNAGYDTKRWTIGGDINLFYNQTNEIISRRENAKINSTYIIKNDWFALSQVEWFSSDEQQIDLRRTILVGAGNYLIRNRRMELVAYSGVNGMIEAFSNEPNEDLTTSELFLGCNYKLFGNDDFDITSSVILFDNLNAKRYRSTLGLQFKWEFIDDFNVNLSYDANYDSAPPNNAQNYDYVINLTLGWKL